MFFWWINVTVNTVVDIMWYLGIAPRPPADSSASDALVNDALGTPPSPAEPTPDGPLPDHDTSPDIPLAQPSPSPPPPPQPIPVAPKSARLYALIIGINDYAHVPTLQGAVPDANAVESFLKTSIGVPQYRIKNLRDRQATRQNIRDALLSLAKCDDIEQGDPILIYYAGHGSEAKAPLGWPSGGENEKIQLLVPCDFVSATTSTVEGQGIPDISLSIIITQLSKAKGDNITVILDSCHSGSGTREESQHPSAVARGIKLPKDYTILSSLDQDLRSTRGDAPDDDSGLASHVLLAGCGKKQLSVEDNGRGRFTKALLDVFVSDGTDKMSYRQLIQRLPLLPQQDPQCEGVNASRILFNNMAPSNGRVLLRVIKDAAGRYKLEAGEAYGITKGAKFDIYADANPGSTCIGSLEAHGTTALTAELRLSPGASPLVLPPQGAYALQTSVGEQPDLRVAIGDHDELLGVYERVKAEMDKNQHAAKRGILPVQDEPYEIAVKKQGRRAVFGITDKFCVDHGLTTMFSDVECSADAVFPILASAADFFYHLRRVSSQRVFTEKNLVELRCFELEETTEYDEDLYPLLRPKGDNLVMQGVINVTAGGKRYGYEIINTSPLPLYAALFYFDMSDLRVSSYYQPSIALHAADPCLLAKGGSLTVGYGSGGHPARKYFLRNGQKFDIGFLKLFVSTDYVDLSHIPQSSPFGSDRGDAEADDPKRDLWDSIQFAIIQNA